ncbi:MAG: chromate transporter [Peptococcaceae bacterium]|nr:chromate transporter [Peptococcaceae bacterium]
MAVLAELFWSFLVIGFTSFGGMSMIPLINSEMIGHGWMTAAEVMDIVAVAEMTPGPLGINCATFAGTRVAGLPGALSATLGVLAPSLTLCLVAAVFFVKFKENKYLQSMLYGIRPVCIGLIGATVISLGSQVYLAGDTLNWRTALIGGIISLLIWKRKLSVPKVIALAAVLGLLLGGS